MNNAIRLHRNAPLLTRNTFHVTAHASWLIEITDNAALANALSLPQLEESEYLLTIGSGSNLLFVTDPPGVILSMRASGVHIIEDNDEYTIVRAD
ncbi:MAG: UDP-N-acetylenolpyruvoylglucosamine reductase, partial [Xanthomonadaceae bacterium]|nr:UDP-N-acetylenolpyruvoylglucosamine reductase [Xanthomonadaceae bacterium]